jgi:hypothetical protein
MRRSRPNDLEHEPPAAHRRRVEEQHDSDDDEDDMFGDGHGDQSDGDDYDEPVANVRETAKHDDDAKDFIADAQYAEEDDHAVDMGKHARTGIGQKPDDVPIMPFNLKDERRAGAFDADGFYVRKAKPKRSRQRLGDDEEEEEDDDSELVDLDDDEEDERDQWIGQWDERQKDKTKKVLLPPVKASAKKTIQVRLRTTAFDNLVVLHHLLEKGETVLEALRRVKSSEDVLSLITECADDLLSDYGVIEAYELTWEEINRLRKKEEQESLKWEYRLVNEDSAEIFGPYSSAEMQDWNNSGYFGEDNLAYIRMRRADDTLLCHQWLSSIFISRFT